MTHDRAGLQAHRKLAETHLVRVQTHMEEAEVNEIAQGGYIHLPDRTRMKRHYMKKLGRKATKTEVQVPRECCSVTGNVVKYDPETRRYDLNGSSYGFEPHRGTSAAQILHSDWLKFQANTIIPLVPGLLPDSEFRLRHTFVIDMAYMEKNKGWNITSTVRGQFLICRIRRLDGVAPPSRRCIDGIPARRVSMKTGYRRVIDGIRRSLDGSMVYYIDIFDPAQEYDCPSQGYVGVLENSPRLLAVGEGEKFKERLMSHISNDGSLLETTMSLPRLWRHNFFNRQAGAEGVLDRAPSVIVLPLDFGLHGGQIKSKNQTDRLRFLEARYMNVSAPGRGTWDLSGAPPERTGYGDATQRGTKGTQFVYQTKLLQ
eukprot:sb/3465828/